MTGGMDTARHPMHAPASTHLQLAGATTSLEEGGDISTPSTFQRGLLTAPEFGSRVSESSGRYRLTAQAFLAHSETADCLSSRHEPCIVEEARKNSEQGQ